MLKPGSLLRHIVAAVPDLRTNPAKLSVLAHPAWPRQREE